MVDWWWLKKAEEAKHLCSLLDKLPFPGISKSSAPLQTRARTSLTQVPRKLGSDNAAFHYSNLCSVPSPFMCSLRGFFNCLCVCALNRG